MEIMTLRLRAPIEYVRDPGVPAWPAFLREEGREDLAAFPASVALMSGDGPSVPRPLPPPEFHGLARRTPPERESPPVVDGRDARFIDAGAYCFAQSRAPGIDAEDPEAIRALVEEFARDEWWERERCEGPYLVRRVFEDGRIAVQVLRRREAPPGEGEAS